MKSTINFRNYLIFQTENSKDIQNSKDNAISAPAMNNTRNSSIIPTQIRHSINTMCHTTLQPFLFSHTSKRQTMCFQRIRPSQECCMSLNFVESLQKAQAAYFKFPSNIQMNAFCCNSSNFTSLNVTTKLNISTGSKLSVSIHKM